MIRILICEDESRYRRLLAKVLGQVTGFQVVGQAATGEQACEQARDLQPDLLLLDLELPGIGGLEVVQRLRPLLPALEILILTSFADETLVFEAVQQGAAGYLVKGISPEDLESAIREVLAGGSVIEAGLARRFWNLFVSVQGRMPQDYQLTAEELEVLTLIGRGLTNPEAAQALGATRRAIKTHLERIYRKLGVSSRVEATVKALQAGLIEL